MRKVVVSMLILLVVLSSGVMTAAQGRVPVTSSRVPVVSSAPADNTVLAQPAPDVPAPDAILWDQPLSTVNTNAYANQDFETAFDAYDIVIADDFVNAEAWTLRNIWVPGNGWNGFTTLMNATALNWQIYADAGGVPAGDPWTGGAFWSLSLPPSDLQVQILTGSGGYPSNTWLTPSNPPVLPAGHWWLVFYPTLPFSPGGQFGRQWSDTTNATVAQVINPGGGFGFPLYWSAAPPLYGVPQQDMAFRLSGSRNIMYVGAISGTSPYPFKMRWNVQIREVSGPKVPDVLVSVEETTPGGLVITDAQLTNAKGVARFQLAFGESGDYTLCVTGATKSGFTYDPAFNIVTCHTITMP